MNENYNFRAFSLAETMITLTIIGAMMVIMANIITRTSLDKDLSRFKKTYTEIESTVAYLLNDELFYGTSSGFKDTEQVSIENAGDIIGETGLYKFREAFKYHIHYVADNIDCPIYKGTSSSGCFKTDYGTVIGIPDTDFEKSGVIEIKDLSSIKTNKITAVPITFYTNYKKGQTVNNDAFVVTVTHDGKINFKYTINKNKDCTSNSAKIQCKLDKYIHATSVKKASE